MNTGNNFNYGSGNHQPHSYLEGGSFVPLNSFNSFSLRPTAIENVLPYPNKLECQSNFENTQNNCFNYSMEQSNQNQFNDQFYSSVYKSDEQILENKMHFNKAQHLPDCSNYTKQLQNELSKSLNTSLNLNVQPATKINSTSYSNKFQEQSFDLSILSDKRQKKVNNNLHKKKRLNSVTNQSHKLKQVNNMSDDRFVNQLNGSKNMGSLITNLVTYNQTIDQTYKSMVRTYEHNLDYNSDSSEKDSVGLHKLQMMTAADLNIDRYARYNLHEEEIKDYVRTITYQNCIEYCAKRYIKLYDDGDRTLDVEYNEETINFIMYFSREKDKVVLVIRCGIGLLPLMCVRNGYARKVIALEESACIEYARLIIKDNGYSSKITLIQSSVHALKQLPDGINEVDVILSDFMGDCVLTQGKIMEQVIEARDRFLKTNGLMIPNCVTLFAQLAKHRLHFEHQRNCKKKKKNNDKHKSDQSYVDSDCSEDLTLNSWWENVYGFDMRVPKDFIEDPYPEKEDHFGSKIRWRVIDPLVTHFKSSKVISDVGLIKEFNMQTCTIDEVRFVQCNNVTLKCLTPYSSTNGGDYAHMLEFFMVVDFPNGQGLNNNQNIDADRIGFSTSSSSPRTRFCQTGLLLRDELIVFNGDEFNINGFYMWRGPQKNQIRQRKNLEKEKQENEESLKMRLNYTFVNNYFKVINRRCAYTLTSLF